MAKKPPKSATNPTRAENEPRYTERQMRLFVTELSRAVMAVVTPEQLRKIDDILGSNQAYSNEFGAFLSHVKFTKTENDNGDE